ncbi:hypothetical protein BDZ45DRAFT_17099 [Acephala macrosclerotiorum]|nr:hypothetical protein BDZ45DRAFT_17099 [Acephala macrosclerotiorum]
MFLLHSVAALLSISVRWHERISRAGISLRREYSQLLLATSRSVMKRSVIIVVAFVLFSRYIFPLSARNLDSSARMASSSQNPPWMDLPTSAYEFLPEPDSPEDNPAFISRALDARLQSYLEYASNRGKKGPGFAPGEMSHLINHIKAAGRFHSAEEGIPIVYGSMPPEIQSAYPLSTKPLAISSDGVRGLQGQSNPSNVSTMDGLPATDDWAGCRQLRSLSAPIYVVEPVFHLQAPKPNSIKSVEIQVVLNRELPRKSELISIGMWDHNPECDKGVPGTPTH